MSNNEYDKYKILINSSPSMASNYINYFLDNQYDISLPRRISESTIEYLKTYLLTYTNGAVLVKGAGNSGYDDGDIYPRTYLVASTDGNHVGYIDKRVIPYLLNYAITEKSVSKDIRMVQKAIRKIANSSDYEHELSTVSEAMISGVFDSNTIECIKIIQSYNNIPQTGYYDRDTEYVMDSIIRELESKEESEDSDNG